LGVVRSVINESIEWEPPPFGVKYSPAKSVLGAIFAGYSFSPISLLIQRQPVNIVHWHSFLTPAEERHLDSPLVIFRSHFTPRFFTYSIRIVCSYFISCSGEETSDKCHVFYMTNVTCCTCHVLRKEKNRRVTPCGFLETRRVVYMQSVYFYPCRAE